MQGIVGQASDFVEVVSKIDWTLLHDIWWREIEKIKGDWRATLWYGFFAWIHQPTHEFDCRTSSGWKCLWGTHVGGHARTRCRVGPGLPMRKKENVEEIYSRSQLAPSWSVKDKSNSVVCQKKNLSSLSCQLAAEEAYTTVSCNNSVVLSNRLSRWASKSENKNMFRCRLALRQKKVPASLTWWHFSEVLIFFALWFSADSRTQKLNSDKFDLWRIRRRMWRNMRVPVQKIVLTQSYDA